jgi:hypothetical protein
MCKKIRKRGGGENSQNIKTGISKQRKPKWNEDPFVQE